MAIETGLNIEDMIDKVIANDLDPAVFSDIDESDIKIAPNCLEFCIGKEFLNVEPYPRQAQMMLHLFEDFCPDCSDPAIINNMHKQAMVEILDRVQLLEYGKCPKCNKTRADFYDQQIFTYPYELDACVGQRFGKSILTAMCSNYVFHRFTTLPNPSRYFGLIPNSPLLGTFTAMDFGQASEALYEPFTAMMESSRWWTEYFDMLKYYGNKKGEELYSVKDTYVSIKHKNLTLYPKGPDKRRMRGRTRFLYAIDEIGWFLGSEGAVRIDAEGVNDALQRSMTTVRQATNYRRLELKDYDAPMGMGFNISSPAHANDMIMRLVRAGHSDPTKKVFHYSTWDAHPRITRASLEPEFRRDPVAAERDYGANPPISNDPFISNKELVAACYRGDNQLKTAAVKYKQGRDTNGNNYDFVELIPTVADKTTPYILTMDAGYTNNSFGVVLSHWNSADSEIIHDLMIECAPHDGRYVNFNALYENTLRPIFTNFNVALIATDRWQGLKMLHDAADEFKCKFEQYSVVWKDFDDYRNKIYDNKVICPKPEDKIDNLFNSTKPFEVLVYGNPVLHCALQMLTVQISGKQVVKGEGHTDDLWRANVLASHFLLSDDPAYRFLKIGGAGNRRSTRALGAVRQRSNGTGNTGSGTTSRVGTVRRKTMG